MEVLDAMVAGVLAGYGIAIPVGAVAVLIIETAARRGLLIGAAAGMGAASADGLYAALAALFGAAIASLLAPWAVALRWASVGVLVAIAGRGLAPAIRSRRRGAADPGAPGHPADASPEGGSGRSGRRTYAAFLGITLLNPMTVAYFAALVLGLPAVQGGPAERLAFAVAAFAASASWQIVLAGIGGLLHRHASPDAIRATSILGNVLILGFAALIARSLLVP